MLLCELVQQLSDRLSELSSSVRQESWAGWLSLRPRACIVLIRAVSLIKQRL